MHLVTILYEHVRMDNITLVDMFRLGRFILAIDPATIKTVTIPVGSGSGTNLVVGSGGPAPASQTLAD